MNRATPTEEVAGSLKCELAREQLRSSGTLRLQATGHSMLPTIWPGDAVVVQRASSGEIREGDVVLFSIGPRFVAHRVVATDSDRAAIQTQGDAARQPDKLVSHRDLLGKVSYIERDGRCIEPGTKLRTSDRAVASLFRRCEFAARVAAGVCGMRRSLPSRLTEKQQTPNHRAVSCPS